MLFIIINIGDIGRIPALAWADLSDGGISDTFQDAIALAPRVNSVSSFISQGM